MFKVAACGLDEAWRWFRHCLSAVRYVSITR